MNNHCVSGLYITLKQQLDIMIKMLHYFHPEVDVEIFSSNDWYNLSEDERRCTYPVIGSKVSKKYRTVTHIDADVFIVDKLDELFDSSSDVRAGRNNSDNNRAGPTDGKFLPGIDWTKYVNVGIHSVTGEEFWNDWLIETLKRGKEYTFGEQDIFNQLFYSGKYKTVLLDPIESKIHFGTSFQDGNRTYWDSWKNIVVVGDHLEINGKRIKMMHLAGGSCRKPEPKELFSKEVADFVENIINS